MAQLYTKGEILNLIKKYRDDKIERNRDDMARKISELEKDQYFTFVINLINFVIKWNSWSIIENGYRIRNDWDLGYYLISYDVDSTIELNSNWRDISPTKNDEINSELNTLKSEYDILESKFKESYPDFKCPEYIRRKEGNNDTFIMYVIAEYTKEIIDCTLKAGLNMEFGSLGGSDTLISFDAFPRDNKRG